MLKKVVRTLGGLFGVSVYRSLPRGVNQFRDVRAAFPNHDFATWFDVGANVGQSISAIKHVFPNARVHSFEPSKETFEVLRRNASRFSTVECHPIGLGEKVGRSNLVLTRDTSMRHVVPDPATAHHAGLGTEAIQLDTLDNFCSVHGVSSLDYLKIDTEGHDLSVVSGATRMLSEERVLLLECELGVDPANETHVPIQQMTDFLVARGFRVFGFYQQKPRHTQALRRTNVVFASSRMLERYPRSHPVRG